MRRTFPSPSHLSVLVASAVFITACGGGGGGGDSAPAATGEVTSLATPNASLATIADNTYKIAYTVEDVIKFGQMWSDPMLTAVSSRSASTSPARSAQDFAVARNATTTSATDAMPSIDCPISGNANEVSSSNNADKTLTREIIYTDCRDAAATANGRVVIVTQLSNATGKVAITGQTTTFYDLNLAADDENLTLNGTAQHSTDTYSKTFTLNLSILDNLTGQTIQADNMRVGAPVDAFLIDRFYRFTMIGKLHFGNEGTLDFNKTDVNSTTIAISGKDGTSMRLIAVNSEAGVAGAVRHIAADTDADGIDDRFAAIPWAEYYPKGANANMPVAVISPANTTTATGTAITLSGQGSTDADRNVLSYEWSVSPATATIAPANAVNPSFTASAPGDYQVLLTVNDGSSSHTEVTTVTVQ